MEGDGCGRQQCVYIESGVRDGELSPDGKWAAYAGEDDKLHYARFGSEKDERVFEIPGVKPGELHIAGWSKDGTAVFYGYGRARPEVRFFRLDLRTGKSEPWKSFPNGDSLFFRAMAMAPDGIAYAYAGARAQMLLYLLEGMR